MRGSYEKKKFQGLSALKSFSRHFTIVYVGTTLPIPLRHRCRVIIIIYFARAHTFCPCVFNIIILYFIIYIFFVYVIQNNNDPPPSPTLPLKPRIRTKGMVISDFID